MEFEKLGFLGFKYFLELNVFFGKLFIMCINITKFIQLKKDSIPQILFFRCNVTMKMIKIHMKTIINDSKKQVMPSSCSKLVHTDWPWCLIFFNNVFVASRLLPLRHVIVYCCYCSKGTLVIAFASSFSLASDLIVEPQVICRPSWCDFQVHPLRAGLWVEDN